MDGLQDYDLLKECQDFSEAELSSTPRRRASDVKPGNGLDDSQKDSLTGLCKRDFFLSLLEKGIAANKQLSVFYIDLNNFKTINDIHGHDVGDVVLKEVGCRLHSLENKSLIFGRMGGDEFVALSTAIEDEAINEIGFSINNVFEQKVSFNTFEYEISVSIGVARFPADARTRQELIKLADVAMYYAKKKELGEPYLITPDVTKRINQHRKVEELLRELDSDKDLFLHFQPIFNNRTGKLEGAESLVRWDHPEIGMISPNIFIPVSEEIGIVQFITRTVFIKSINQIKKWNEKYGLNLYVSINVSTNCIHNRIFFYNLKEMITVFKINPDWITIELTEFVAMHSPRYMTKLLYDIKKLGVKIAIDDYGTGVSSLLHIKNFGVDYLKIDQSFVAKFYEDEKYRLIVGATIAMAKYMGISSIGKGVETAEQHNLLKDLGCDYVQGFKLGYPVSADSFESRYLEKMIP